MRLTPQKLLVDMTAAQTQRQKATIQESEGLVCSLSGHATRFANHPASSCDPGHSPRIERMLHSPMLCLIQKKEIHHPQMKGMGTGAYYKSSNRSHRRGVSTVARRKHGKASLTIRSLSGLNLNNDP